MKTITNEHAVGGQFNYLTEMRDRGVGQNTQELRGVRLGTESMGEFKISLS